MKKNIVALAVASAIAAPVAMADAPTVYGQINMALEQMSSKDVNGDKVKADSGTQVNSRASRIGVKGSNDLGNGLKAVYKVEFEVQIDKSSELKNRNQYVGLAGGFGTVLMGRHDTPLKMIQAKDLFNDAGLSDNKPISGGLGALGAGGEVRASNVLAYVSPSFGGVKLMAAFIPKEDGSQYGGLQNNTNTDADSESSLSDAMSFAAMYGSKKKGLYLAAAYNTWDKQANLGNYNPVTKTGQEGSVDELRITAQYTIAGLIANAMYQDFSGKGLKNSTQKGTNIQANVGYKIGNFMPKVKVSMVDRDKNAAGDKYKDSTNYAVGLNYSLGKKTTAYVEYAALENTAGTVTKDKSEDTAFSIGMVHKF
jgi:predicted porin